MTTTLPIQAAEARGAGIGTWRAPDGYLLHYRHWIPEVVPPRGRVLALHGIQSHSGWYGWSCERLAAAGYEVCYLDRRGCGMNEPARGDARNAEQLIDDVTGFARNWRGQRAGERPVVPLVLMGVSWGGKLAALVAAREPGLLDGLALLYPGLRAQVRLGWLQNLQLTLAGRLGWQSRRVPIPLDDPGLFTSQPRFQQFIRNDPLALHEVTVRFLLANRALDQRLPRLAGSVHCPALLMLAGQDQIIDNQATRAMFERLTAGGRTIIEYPGAQHTLEFERDRDQFVGDLLAWLEAIGLAAGATGGQSAAQERFAPAMEDSGPNGTEDLRAGTSWGAAQNDRSQAV